MGQNTHSMLDIIKDTFGRVKLSKIGRMIIFMPISPEHDDIILVLKDSDLALVSMYKKPEISKDWKINHTHTGIIIRSKKPLSEMPEKIVRSGDILKLTYKSGTTAEIGIDETIPEEAIKTSSKMIRMVPDEAQSLISSSRLISHPQTNKLVAFNGEVMVGNQSIAIRYEDKEADEIKITNAALIENIKRIGKQTGQKVAVTVNNHNTITYTNTGSSLESSELAEIYLLTNNFSNVGGRTAEKTINSINALMEHESKKSLIKFEGGQEGILQMLKDVTNKYHGDQKYINIIIDKTELKIEMTDNITSIKNKIDYKANAVLPTKMKKAKIINITKNMAAYLSDMTDKVMEISHVNYTGGELFILETENERAAFKSS
jgi:hypothetical protein